MARKAKKRERKGDQESKQVYKKMRSVVNKEMAKAEAKAYDEIYENLDSREGEKDLYRFSKQRVLAGRGEKHRKMINDTDGNVSTSEESVS